jgi:hypothetical protein
LRRARLPEPGEEPGEAVSGILFPSNGDNSVENVVFLLSGSAMPDIAPLTLIWKINPTQHAGYRTTFFHGRTDGVFLGSMNYVGCHPYPNPAPNGTNANWEISINGTDYIVDENGNSTVVTHGVWKSQAVTIENVAGQAVVNFYWDLRTSTNRRIIYDGHGNGPLVNATQDPALFFGDAMWSLNQERLSGILRGIQVYQAVLPIAQIQTLDLRESDSAALAYCSANSITPWYLAMNPTPSDISDRSGAGHHPVWLDTDRPTLWTP